MNIIKRLIVQVKDLFTHRKQDTDVSTTKINLNKEPDAVTHMNSLKDGLNKIKDAYDKSIKDVKVKYNKKLDEHNKAYENYQNVFTRYKNKMLSDEELEKEKKVIQGYHEAVAEVGEVIDEVESYKYEDVMAYMHEMESLKDDYTTQLAGQITNKAYHLKNLKKQYFNTLSEIQGLYAEARETETVMNQNTPFKSNISEILRIKTEQAPLKVSDLTLEQTEIIGYLQKDLSHRY